MKKFIGCTTVIMMLFPLSISAQKYLDDSGKVKVWIVKDPYTDSRTGPELVKGPDRLASGIASTPYGQRDPDHLSRQAAIRLIEGAVKGVKKRK